MTPHFRICSAIILCLGAALFFGSGSYWSSFSVLVAGIGVLVWP